MNPALRMTLAAAAAAGIAALRVSGGEIPVTDAAVRAGLSPYNWTVRDDSISTAIGGAHLMVQFSGTRKVSLRVDMSAFPGPEPTSLPIIAWSVNGGEVRTHQLAAGKSTVVLADDAVDPVIDLFIKGISPWEDRWTGDVPVNSVRLTGFVVDDGAVAKVMPQPEKIWLNIGDSIMAGDGAAYAEGQGRPKRDEWPAADDARASYGWLLARHFGHRESRIAFGGYNWAGGLAKVPDLATVVARLVTSPPPAVVLVNLGTNGRPKAEDVIAALEELRRRCGSAAKIIVMVPVSGAARAEVTRAFKTWQAAAPDANAHLVDLGNVVFAAADKVHPTAAGHRAIFEAALPEVEKLLGTPSGDGAAAIVSREYVVGDLPTPSCHASTIAETKPGTFVVAWFGGTAEGNADVGIWLSRLESGAWTRPVEVATGVQPDGTRWPCWNPVLFQKPGGALLLFSKVGPDPRRWWGLVRSSEDGGRSWSEPVRLSRDHTAIEGGPVGPIKNKPVRLADGTLLAPSSTEYAGWRVHFERSVDGGATWEVIGPVNDGTRIGAIQPSILDLGGGRLVAVGRTRDSRRIFRVESGDGGRTWGEMTLGDLPNPNSGTDAVTLADGRHLLVYNHAEQGRSPLNIAVSDDGAAWTPAVVLETEPAEFSYPAIMQAADGTVHVTYTWKRRKIAHVVVDPARIGGGHRPAGAPVP